MYVCCHGQLMPWGGLPTLPGGAHRNATVSGNVAFPLLRRIVPAFGSGTGVTRGERSANL
jgi:hypothetical protein